MTQTHLGSVSAAGRTSLGSVDANSASLKDASGALVPRFQWRILRVVGPASYATGGFAVDCSSFFSSVLAAAFQRQFVTATGLRPATAFVPNVVETGANVFSSAKFQVVQYRTLASQSLTFTGSALGGAHSCGSVACDSSHPNTSTVPAGTVTSVAASALNEQPAGNDMSANTYEFLVLGVPV